MHDGGIVGREEELQAIFSFLEQRAAPAALLIEGEAGIGKTTLWLAGVEAARELSYVVLSARPAEKEATFAYSAVGDLLEYVLDEVLAELPGPQRRALEVALLRREPEGPPPEQHTLGVALLGVLRALAEARAVLLGVDDIQWLDPSSAAILDFAARRLREERVTLLLARRQTSGAEGLELAIPENRRLTLQVGPLSMGALHRLLRDRLGTTLARPALAKVHEASGGNPFYALELVRALQGSGGRVKPGHPLPVPATLEGILRQRIDSLPPDVREVLAEAAALRRPTESVLGWPALEQAVEAGLIEVTDGEVHFTHPLLASAAYGSITAAERRHLHRRLAAVVSDPEERARHLALSAAGPSKQVADALDEAAREAASRGAPAAAAELAELAVRLTPAGQRGRLLERRAEAAALHLPAGELGSAASILEHLVDELPPGAARADAFLLLASSQQSFERCLPLAMAALADARGDDARVAKTECYIGELLMIQGASEQALEHARAAVAAAEQAGDPTILAIALSTVAWFETGAAVEPTPGVLERAVILEDAGLHGGVRVADTSSASFALGMRLMFAGRLDEARARMGVTLDRAVSLGDEGAVSAALLHLAELEFRAGNWPLAARHAADGYEHAEQMGREQDMSALLYAGALVDAHLGRVEEARGAAERGIALSESCGDEVFRLQHVAVLGFLELSLGDAGTADGILRPLAAHLDSYGWREPSIYGELPNAIEALVELAELEEARRLLADLQDRISRIESPWSEASAGRCEGLILAAEGDLPGALAALERALAVHERLPQPFDLARTLLVLGVTRRRARERRAARESLERALAVFDELGAALWAAKARSELGRIGGRAPAGDELTPSERRIAELVAEGKTNREVAAVLVVTDRTVESALTHIYRKLDVRSRTQLARKLAAHR